MNQYFLDQAGVSAVTGVHDHTIGRTPAEVASRLQMLVDIDFGDPLSNMFAMSYIVSIAMTKEYLSHVDRVQNLLISFQEIAETSTIAKINFVQQYYEVFHKSELVAVAEYPDAPDIHASVAEAMVARFVLVGQTLSKMSGPAEILNPFIERYNDIVTFDRNSNEQIESLEQMLKDTSRREKNLSDKLDVFLQLAQKLRAKAGQAESLHQSMLDTGITAARADQVIATIEQTFKAKVKV